MMRTLQNTLSATALTGLSLYLWRITYLSSDWAILALLPLAVAIGAGLWPLTINVWRAQLHVALREDSSLGKFLTGRIRAVFLSGGFTFVAVTLMAWQALSASIVDAAIMLVAFSLSASIFSTGQSSLSRHFHEPFASAMAVSLVTWLVALPFTFIIAGLTYAWAAQSGAMLDADLQDALQIGLGKLPARGGFIAGILAVPYGYEAAKLWAVVQLRDYPIVGALFSLDAALFSFVLCRAGIGVMQFIETRISRRNA